MLKHLLIIPKRLSFDGFPNRNLKEMPISGKLLSIFKQFMFHGADENRNPFLIIDLLLPSSSNGKKNMTTSFKMERMNTVNDICDDVDISKC
jgi:ectoine hydroxylase-related dioxygenase (phytanoyl-CoA dioxygenase family)